MSFLFFNDARPPQDFFLPPPYLPLLCLCPGFLIFGVDSVFSLVGLAL